MKDSCLLGLNCYIQSSADDVFKSGCLVTIDVVEVQIRLFELGGINYGFFLLASWANKWSMKGAEKSGGPIFVPDLGRVTDSPAV